MLREGDKVVLFVTTVAGRADTCAVWGHTNPGNVAEDELEKLMAEAERELSAGAATVNPDNINVGNIFLAKFSEDGRWYRAKVCSKTASSVTVYFVDYGNEEVVSMSDIAAAQPKYLDLPPQVTEFVLADIQPKNGNAWTPTELSELSEQLSYTELPGQVLKAGTVGYPAVIRLFEEEAGSTASVVEKIVASGVGSMAKNDMSSRVGLEKIMLRPNQSYHVYIAFYESPVNFCLQLVENEDKIEELQAAIEHQINNSSPGLYQVQPGTLCIAKYLDVESGTETFYRAIVTEVLENGRFNVTFVDYGNKETVSGHEIKQIPSSLMKLPVQGIQCCLHRASVDLSKFEKLMEAESMNLTVKSIMASGLHVVGLSPPGGETQVRTVRPSPQEQQQSVAPARVTTHYTPLQFNVGKYVDLCISSVEKSGTFYCQLLEHSLQLNQVMESLEQTYRMPHAPMTALTGEVPCVTQSVVDSGVYYRSRVVGVVQGQAQVLHVDFGTWEAVPLANILPISEKFLQMPTQAIHCCLSGADNCDPLAVANVLKRYESQKAVVGSVKLKTGQLYEMDLIDTSGPTDIKVSSLIGSGMEQVMNGLEEYRQPDLVKGQWEDVQVTSVDDPEHFYCHLLKDEDALNNLMARIEAYCTAGPRRPPPLKTVGLGIPCLAKYQEDGMWYRAYVSGVMANGTVEVHFVDYGNHDSLHQDSLCAIPPEFLQLQVQAIQATLEGVFAGSDCMWSNEEIDLFVKVTSEERHPMMVIDYDDLTERYSVELFRDAVNINETFGQRVGKLSTRHIAPVLPPPGQRMASPPVAKQHKNITPPRHQQQQAAGWAAWQQSQMAIPPSPKSVVLKTQDLDNCYKDVFVEFTVHPEEFYCSLADTADAMLDMMNTLNEEYGTFSASDLQLPSVKQGQICCAPFADNRWYRSRVLGIAGELAVVQYVDYGNTETVKLRELKQLKEAYTVLPIQGIPCRMSGIAPASMQWTAESKDVFENLTTDKKLVCGFISHQNDGAYLVELIETLAVGQKVINDELVALGIAVNIKPPVDLPMNVAPSTRQPTRRASNSSTSSSNSSLRAGTQEKYRYTSLKEGQFVDINIVHVESPSHFCCQLTKFSSDLEVLMDSLHDEYSGLAEGELRFNAVRPDTVCCARYSEDKEWYRAEITSAQRDELQVSFVDYGNSEKCSPREVWALKPEYIQLPVQAIPCTLDGIRMPAGGWTLKAKEDFEDLVMDKNLVAKVCALLPNKMYKLSIVDKTDKGDRNIANLLNEMGICSLDVPPAAPTPPRERPAVVKPVTQTVQPVQKKTFLPPEIKVGQDLAVQIVWAENLSSFWCQPMSCQVTLETLMFELCEYYENLRIKDEEIAHPEPGQACVALFTDDGSWYRSLVLQTHNREAEVLYIDYGNKAKLTWSKLKQIKPQFLEVPQQAFHCCLNNVEAFGNKWNRGVESYFEELMSQKLMCSVVSCDNSVFRVTLVDGSGKDVNSTLGQILGLSPPQPVRAPQRSTPPRPPPSAAPHGQGMVTPPRSATQTKLVPMNTPLRPGSRTSMTVSNIEGFDLFYCQLTENIAALDTFMETLEAHYAAGKESPLSLAQVRPGMACAAQFSEDNYWYRASITKILPDNRLEVQFVDYGNSEITTVAATRELQHQFYVYPLQAFKCRLAGVSGTSNPGTLLRFRELVEEQSISGVVKNRTEDCVDVELFNNDKSVDVNSEVRKLIGSAPPVASRVAAVPLTAPHFKPSCATIGETAGVYITHVDSPGSFWVQKNSDSDQVTKMADTLFNEYNCLAATENQLTAASVGTACVAKYSEDLAWYRATIEQINGNQVSVRFIDYGNADTAAIGELKTVSPDWLAVPPYGIHCRLYGMKEPEGGWKDSQVKELEKHEEELQATFVKGTDPVAVTLKENGRNIAESIGTVEEEVDAKQDKPASFPSQIVPEQAASFISQVDNLNRFYIQLTDQTGDLEKVSEDLQTIYCDLSAEESKLASVSRGAACCAKFSEDEAWYRAIVESVENQSINVRFVDFGNREATSIANLKELRDDLLKIPVMAFECTLYGITCPSSGWPEGVAERFETLTVDKDLGALFKTRSVPYAVSLTVEREDLADILLREFPALSGQQSVKTRQDVVSSDVSVAKVEYKKQDIPGKACQVYVSHAESPSEFYIQVSGIEEELEEFVELLNERYRSLDKETACLERPSIGQACCGKFSEDEAWYRATIIAVAGEQIKVRFVDYGNTETLAAGDVKVLQAEFAGKPCYAIQCCLSGTDSDHKWSPEEIKKFQELVPGDQEAKCQFITTSQPYEVLLTYEDVDINASFVLSDEQSQTESESEGFETPREIASDVEVETLSSLPVAIPPASGNSVFVSVIESPSLFYVQKEGVETVLDTLSSLLIAESTNRKPSTQVLSKGQLCSAQSADDGVWYRGCVKEVGADKATVQFIDYGNSEDIILNNILPLPAPLRQQAPVAVACCLKSFPADKDWTDDQIELFTELTVDKELTVEVLNKSQPYSVVLKDGDVNITEALGVTPEDKLPEETAGVTSVTEKEPATSAGGDGDESSDDSEFTDALEDIEEKRGQVEDEVSEDIEDKRGQVEDEVSGDIEEKRGQVEDEVSEDIEEKRGQVEDEASEDIEEKRGQVEDEASEDIEEKRGQVEDELSEDIEEKRGQEEDEALEDIEEKRGQVKDEASEDIEEKRIQVEDEELEDIEEKRGQEEEEASEDIEEKRGQVEDKASEDIEEKRGQVKDEASEDIEEKRIQVEDEELEDIEEKRGQVEDEASGDIEEKRGQVEDEVSEDIEEKRIQVEDEESEDIEEKRGQVEDENKDGNAQAEMEGRGTTLSVGQKVEVYISHVTSPSQFWCQLARNTAQLDAITDSLSEVCASGDDHIDISPGLLCAVKYSEMEWCRASILSVIDDQVEVNFVDYGNTDRVYQTNLRPLPAGLRLLEPQAMECLLHGVKAAKETWTDHAIDYFHELTGERKLLAEVTMKSSNHEGAADEKSDSYVVKLLDMGMSVADKLVKAGHAVESEVTTLKPSNGIQQAVTDTVPTSPEKADLYTTEDLNRAKGTLYFAADDIEDSDIVSLPVRRLDVGERAEVYVSHVEALDKFWVQLKSQEALLEIFGEEMQEAYHQNAVDIDERFQETLRPGLICAAHSAECESWYRGCVRAVRVDEVEVFCVDYGNTETLPLDQLQPLKPKFQTQTQQALKCSLGNTVTWSDAAVELFRKETADKMLIAEVLSVKEDSHRLKLLDMGTCVLQHLLEAGAEIDIEETEQEGVQQERVLETRVVGQQPNTEVTEEKEDIGEDQNDKEKEIIEEGEEDEVEEDSEGEQPVEEPSSVDQSTELQKRGEIPAVLTETTDDVEDLKEGRDEIITAVGGDLTGGDEPGQGDVSQQLEIETTESREVLEEDQHDKEKETIEEGEQDDVEEDSDGEKLVEEPPSVKIDQSTELQRQGEIPAVLTEKTDEIEDKALEEQTDQITTAVGGDKPGQQLKIETTEKREVFEENQHDEEGEVPKEEAFDVDLSNSESQIEEHDENELKVCEEPLKTEDENKMYLHPESDRDQDLPVMEELTDHTVVTSERTEPDTTEPPTDNVCDKDVSGQDDDVGTSEPSADKQHDKDLIVPCDNSPQESTDGNNTDLTAVDIEPTQTEPALSDKEVEEIRGTLSGTTPADGGEQENSDHDSDSNTSDPGERLEAEGKSIKTSNPYEVTNSGEDADTAGLTSSVHVEEKEGSLFESGDEKDEDQTEVEKGEVKATSEIDSCDTLTYKTASFRPGQRLEVNTSMVTSPGDFWCQLVKPSTTDLPLLSDRIQDEYSTESNGHFMMSTIKVGLPCIAKCSTDDNWYRALVISVDSDGPKVQFVDYGNAEVVRPSEIRAMLPELMALDAQAFRCRLAGVLPSGEADQWDETSCARFEELVTDKDLALVVTAVCEEADKTTTIDVDLQDGLCSIAELMIDSGYAQSDVQRTAAGKDGATQEPSGNLREREGSSSDINKFDPTPWHQPLTFDPKTVLSVIYIAGVSPDDFVCRLQDSGDDVEALLLAAVKEARALETPEVFKIGSAVLVEKENAWHRGYVTVVSESQCQVELVDVGTCVKVENSRLLPLNTESQSVPPQAVRCSLAGIESEEWTQESYAVFEELCRGEELSVNVVEVGEDNIHSVYLYNLRDPSGQSINSQLISKGFAWVTVNSELAEMDITSRTDGLLTGPQQDLESSFLDVTTSMNSSIGSLGYGSDHADEGETAGESMEFSSQIFTMGEELEVKLVSVSDPDNLVCHNMAWESELQQLMDDLRETYSSGAEAELPELETGQVCVARQTGKGDWSRCRMLAKQETGVIVLYVDYGNTEIVPLTETRRMKRSFLDLPIQAIHCSLDGLLPVTETWSPETRDVLLEMTQKSDSPKATVVLVEENGKLLVNLKIRDQDLGEALVMKGLAVSSQTCVDKDVGKEQEVEAKIVTQVPPANSQVGDVLTVTLTSVIDPGCFWCQIDPQTSKKLVDDIQGYYNNSVLEFDEEPSEGWTCVSRGEEDQRWHRTRIQSIYEGLVTLVDVDDGTVETVAVNSIRPLVEQFAAPAGALHCSLSKPESTAEWSEAAAGRLEQLVGSVLHLEVQQLTPEGVVEVAVTVISTGQKVADIVAGAQLAAEASVGTKPEDDTSSSVENVKSLTAEEE